MQQFPTSTSPCQNRCSAREQAELLSFVMPAHPSSARSAAPTAEGDKPHRAEAAAAAPPYSPHVLLGHTHTPLLWARLTRS